MVKINLYKDGNLVLTKEGKIEDKDCVFGNIVYNLDDLILTREDASYKYQLDFHDEEAFVLLKDQNYVLDLTIKVISRELSDKLHKISYVIESENKISNDIEIIME